MFTNLFVHSGKTFERFVGKDIKKSSPFILLLMYFLLLKYFKYTYTYFYERIKVGPLLLVALVLVTIREGYLNNLRNRH